VFVALCSSTIVPSTGRFSTLPATRSSAVQFCQTIRAGRSDVPPVPRSLITESPSSAPVCGNHSPRARDARLAILGFAPAALVGVARAPRCAELIVPGDREFESVALQR
jgi:hypothetical protein